MFPCGSIYQNSPLTNQTTMTCKQLEIIDDHDHQEPNSNQEYYSHLPTIFEDEGLMLSHLLSQKQVLMASGTSTTSSTTTSHDNINITNCPSKGFSKKKQTVRGGGIKTKTVNNPRRRTGKKDRHSKISTAQGLRDRRMRLSLQIARKFFDLQDMLGFDKASKTIDWLFNKSKTAIRELKASLTKPSSCSNNDDHDEDDLDDEILVGNNANMPGEEIRKKNNVKKLNHCKVAKESRDKARARARERTREKKMLQKSTQTSQMSPKSMVADEILEPDRHMDLVSINEKFQAEMMTTTMMMTSVADYYSMMMTMSNSGEANSEDNFLGLFPPENWEPINASLKPQSFCDMNYKPLHISNTTLDTREEKPSTSMFLTSTSNTGTCEENPRSVFMAATAAAHHHELAEDPNPNHGQVFMNSATFHIQDQNPAGSNVFHNTVNF